MHLRLLNHVDVLRDALGLVVEFHHRCLDYDGIGFVEAATVGDEVHEEL